jgi:hypothetical protein
VLGSGSWQAESGQRAQSPGRSGLISHGTPLPHHAPRPFFFPDTVSKVIHCRGRRAAAKPSSAEAPAVNNFAESAAELVKNLPLANDGPVRKAPRPARFSFPNPSRVCSRSPAGSRAAVQRSERTTSHENFCIRSTSDGPPTSLQPQQNRIVKMQSWSEITHYAGFDWATHHHDVVIVNRTGKIVADFHS